MNIQNIKDACDYIVLNPNEPHKTDKLECLVEEARQLNYALVFLTGHNLLNIPFIQGYVIEEISLDKN